MPPFPLPLHEMIGKAGTYGIVLLIGFVFGYALEIGGFNKSTKLAAQFYFKDLTVLKVMFTAIIVAMVLVFGASALGLLDYNLVWVNPTYLWPGIVGGLIMGVGFILGGFCPGTSLVAVGTGKIDGFFFAGGLFTGIFLFGETVSKYDIFWNSSYMGRFTLMDWLGLPAGVVVLLVVLMALFMFWGAEQLERIVGGKDTSKEPRLRFAGAGALVIVALAVLFIGQPSAADKWARLAPEKEPLLKERAVQISPAELLHTMYDHSLKLVMLDVRAEPDYNLFHISEAQRVDLEDIPALTPELLLEPENTVFVVMSNGEDAATDAWKELVAESVPNVYILDGGVNNWLAYFAADDPRIQPTQAPVAGDMLGYTFAAALGHTYPAAEPSPELLHSFEYEPKIKLELKRGPTGGGCG